MLLIKKQKILFIFFFGLFLLSASFCLAKLEVTYPPLMDGRTIASDTPLPEYLKYVFDFGIGIGFATVFYGLVAAGIMYLLSPALPSMQAKAKDQVAGAFSGLIILLAFYLIITAINPELAFFRIKSLDPIAPAPPPGIPAGVYLYKNDTCQGESEAKTSSIYDLGNEFRNKLGSIKIINQPDNEYISIVYDLPGLRGKCREIDSGTNCDKTEYWPTSASIHKYSFSSEGDGVYLYYKSFFNKDGGYYKIPNSQIDPFNIYSAPLQDLRFIGNGGNDCTVPKDQQKCIKWDDKSNCTERECPNLAGKNISSIEIKGNYIVLLVYFGPGDKNLGPWTSCQEFPTPEDINKEGPKQIKWENILNNSQPPNYILIYPVKEK